MIQILKTFKNLTNPTRLLLLLSWKVYILYKSNSPWRKWMGFLLLKTCCFALLWCFSEKSGVRWFDGQLKLRLCVYLQRKIDVSASFTAHLELFAPTIDVWSGIIPFTIHLFQIDCVSLLRNTGWMKNDPVTTDSVTKHESPFLIKKLLCSSRESVRDICSTECVSLKNTLSCAMFTIQCWFVACDCSHLKIHCNLFRFCSYLCSVTHSWKEMKTTYVLQVEGMKKNCTFNI